MENASLAPDGSSRDFKPRFEWSTFSIRTLLALTFLVAIAAFLWPKPDPNAPDPKWRETLLSDSEPLWNVPVISFDSQQDGKVTVTAANTGRTTLEYRGTDPTQILLFQEVRGESGWQRDAWSVDGMCEETFEIAPGDSVKLEFEFWDDGNPTRMLGRFSEKATNRSGVVVLATSDQLD